MREMTESELTARIHAFIGKKSAKFPDVSQSLRVRTFIPRSILKNTEFDTTKRLHVAM